jgi:transcriptional/translational regulatory protein YebC/TACO1
MVEAATDNSMRTTSEVKNIFSKNGGSFGQPGSVAYQFKQIGRVIVAKNGKSFDDIFAIALDAGAEDIKDVEDEVYIDTQVHSLSTTRQALQEAGLTILATDLVREPVISMEITDDEMLVKLDAFISHLEELDDVQKVYTNLA